MLGSDRQLSKDVPHPSGRAPPRCTGVYGRQSWAPEAGATPPSAGARASQCHYFTGPELDAVRVDTWATHPLARSWCYLGVFPRYSGVGRRRDGCPTRVRDAKAHEFLVLHPIVVGASDQHYLRPAMGDAYPHWGAPGHAEARVPFSGSWVRWAGGKIPLARA
jgi:hypothetical protein